MLRPCRRAHFWKLLLSSETKHHNPRSRTGPDQVGGEAKEIKDVLVVEVDNLIDVDELRSALAAVDGVTEVHDLHVWTLVPGKDMATAHLTSNGHSDRVLDDARAVLAARGLA